MKTIKIFAYALAVTSGFVFTSCGSDDSGSNDLPPIGGYESADEVGAADLIAYFPLNGDGKEMRSGAMPKTTVGATWVEGKKGQAVKLNAGYLDYDPITDLNVQSGNITVSCWAKITNTKLTPDAASTISPLVSFSGGTSVVGNLSIFGNTHGLVSSDSIEMKAQYFFKKPDGEGFGGDCVNLLKLSQGHIDENNASQTDIDHAAFPNKIGGQWAHIVFTWEGSSGTARLYVNGVKISNPKWEIRNGGNPMPMAFFTPTRPTIGALASFVAGTTDAWNAPLKGEIDEIRVWKKTLPLNDINALYQLESAGR
jgi:hypothetical protein